MSTLKDHHMPLSRCPNCTRELDGAINADPVQSTAPRAGDLTVCLGCASLLVFREDFTLLPLGGYEFDKLPRDVRRALSKARAAVLALRPS